MTFPTAFKPLTKDDIAGVLSVSSRTIENWVNEGTVPPPAKIGNRVYWHPGVFYAWLDQRLVPESAEEKLSAEAEMCVGRRKMAHSSAQFHKTELAKLGSRDQAKLESLLS